MSGKKFCKELQVRDKIYWVNFSPIRIQLFMNDSKPKNNNSEVFKNSQMDMRAYVWVGESFLNYDKW